MELKTILNGVVSASPGECYVRELIFICKKIALVYLRNKASRGHLYQDGSTLCLEDLALDCVADLFSRGEDGSFQQIKLYFDGLPIDNSSEEELLTHLRRLVFARTNQSIFRMYREADPCLSKIVRNIKLAVQSLQNFIALERFGELCLAPTMCDTLEHLPPFEQSELEHQLRHRLSDHDSIPSMLTKYSLFIREQDQRCRLVCCMTLARVFRSIYETPYLAACEQTTSSEFTNPSEVMEIIHSVCRAVKLENLQHYISRKKITKEVYESYFDVIHQNLYQRLIQHNGKDFSYFNLLKQKIPNLTKEDYNRTHRSKLEYLARLSYKRTVKELKTSF